MMNTNEKLKDHYFQVSENILDLEAIEDIMNLYGAKGLGLWLMVSLKLLKNNGVKTYNWKYFSNDEDDKEPIEFMIENSSLFSINVNENTFSSYIVNEQIEERLKIKKNEKCGR